MKKLGLLVILCMQLFLATAYGNGGPVEISTLAVGGNISFSQEEQIYVTQENLNLQVMPYYTNVSVIYHLKNQGDKRIVYYVFPVDIFQNFDDMYWEIKNISFRDGDEELPYEVVEHISPEDWENKIKNFHAYQYIFCNEHQINYLSVLDFDAQEEKVVEISYTVKNGYMGWGNSNRVETNYDDIVFAYDLQPAAYWGMDRRMYFRST